MIDARIIKRLHEHDDAQQFELNIHLRSNSGFTVLLGPSGSGKTLTLDCLAGLQQPDEGRILINNQIYFDAQTKVHLSPQQRRCGYIFQDHALFPHMTLRQNMEFAASCGSKDKQSRLERRRRINELLEALHLSELPDRKPHQLSGGQKQRASIARALVNEPQLLLFDEPTQGLDFQLRLSFYEMLREIYSRFHVPIILVTHDLDECFEIAETVCILEYGKLLQSGPLQEVFRRPANVEMARSLGLYNLLPAEILSLDPSRNLSLLSAADHEIEGPYLPGHLIGDRGWLCLRHQDLRVFPKGGRKSRNQLVLPLVQKTSTPRGLKLLFLHDISAEISEAEFIGMEGEAELAIEISSSSVYFLSK